MATSDSRKDGAARAGSVSGRDGQGGSSGVSRIAGESEEEDSDEGEGDDMQVDDTAALQRLPNTSYHTLQDAQRTEGYYANGSNVQHPPQSILDFSFPFSQAHMTLPSHPLADHSGPSRAFAAGEASSSFRAGSQPGSRSPNRFIGGRSGYGSSITTEIQVDPSHNHLDPRLGSLTFSNTDAAPSERYSGQGMPMLDRSSLSNDTGSLSSGLYPSNIPESVRCSASAAVGNERSMPCPGDRGDTNPLFANEVFGQKNMNFPGDEHYLAANE